MRIVFGWYSFKIKSYKPEDLNIKKEQQEDISFEVRQKCFHLFWIPFFSIGKMYALRKEGKLYNLPKEYVTLIKSKGKHKTPWYSFLLPILVVLGFIGYELNEKYESHKRHQYWTKEYNYSINQIDKGLAHLKAEDYIKIRNLSEWNKSENMFLKVLSVSDSIVYFVFIELNCHALITQPYYINKYYKQHSIEFDTLAATIEEFKKMVCRDYTIYSRKSEFGYPILTGNNSKFIIEKVGNLDGPIIEVLRSGSSYSNIKLLNFGIPVELIKIDNLEGNPIWEGDLPQYMTTDSTNYKYSNICEIACKNYQKDEKYKIMLTFKDSANIQYKYILNGCNFDKKLERVLK